MNLTLNLFKDVSMARELVDEPRNCDSYWVLRQGQPYKPFLILSLKAPHLACKQDGDELVFDVLCDKNVSFSAGPFICDAIAHLSVRLLDSQCLH